MKQIEMWCRGYRIENIVSSDVVIISEELFDLIVDELNNSIPIEWIMERKKHNDNKVLMIEDWKNENEYRKSRNEKKFEGVENVENIC